jgi:hypothetical protein
MAEKDILDKLVPISLASSPTPAIAPLPPSQDTTPDQLTSFYRPSPIPYVRHSPLPPSASAQINAVAKTIATQVATNLISKIPAPPQQATQVSDGLIHGDAIWEIDPAYSLVRDEFMGGTTTTGGIGDVGWSLFTFNSGGAKTAVRGVAGLPAMGAFAISNGSNANGYDNVNLTASSVGAAASPFIPLFDYPVGWKAIFIFALATGDADALTAPYFTQKSLYVGLASAGQVSAWPARPAIFMGLRYDTDTTAPSIADSTFHFEVVSNPATNSTRNNTQGTVIDTGIAPDFGVYRLEIEMIAPGVITMSLNGSAPQTFSVPTATAGGTGASGQQAMVVSNIGRFNPGTLAGSSNALVFAAGSKVAISGITTVALAFLNAGGPYTLLNMAVEVSGHFRIVHANVGNTSSANGAMTGFPAVIPIFSFGNDTQAAPTADTLSFLADFFSLVWNPGVGGGTGTPNRLLPRYF